MIIPPPPPPRSRNEKDGKEPPKPKEEKKIIPPLKIFVKGIVGNEVDGRYAIIEFDKDEKTIKKTRLLMVNSKLLIFMQID